jgi:hypothetical protein
MCPPEGSPDDDEERGENVQEVPSRSVGVPAGRLQGGFGQVAFVFERPRLRVRERLGHTPRGGRGGRGGRGRVLVALGHTVASSGNSSAQ